MIVDCADNPIDPTSPALSETVNPVGRPSFERPANKDLAVLKFIDEFSSINFWVESSSLFADGDSAEGVVWGE